MPIVTVNTWYHVGSGDETPGPHRLRPPVRAHHVHGLAARADRASSTSCSRPPAPTTTAPRPRTAPTTTRTGPSNALPLMLWLDSRPDGLPAARDHAREGGPAARRGAERAAPELREPALRARRGEHPEAALPGRAPYNWPVIGSMADLSAATIEDVRDFFRTYYTPNNATMRHRRRRRPGRGAAPGRAVVRRHPARPGGARDAPPPRVRLDGRRPTPRSRTACSCRASTTPGTPSRRSRPDDAALSVAGRASWRAASPRGSTSASSTSCRSPRRSTAYQDGARLDGSFRLLADGAAGPRPATSCSASSTRRSARLADERAHGARAGAGPEPDRGPVPRPAWRPALGGKADQLELLRLLRRHARTTSSRTSTATARVTAADVQRVARALPAREPTAWC